ncbi:lysophospholipid acyltransferase family protein [Rubricoccus marinus]|uniref:Phospholipid/glycerol acyltransferase domain-containing protein n=1 Tax=Rubricoccus marinus TaxID=716817 RepID=A0A259TZF4_9BACT|nr:1-acyl-sn-glycerol-3-phosphate acyltransferase [Rubricoccus marinus]OZC03066.1 hypothetical protein BSZ36_08840 [Rubricoccus marinus]
MTPLPYPEAAATLPPTTFAGALLGVLRLLATILLVAVGTVVLLLSALIPGRIQDARLAMWVSVWISRIFLAITGLKVDARGAEVLRAHSGFVFFNHVSYMDIVVLLSIRPVRFLATAGVRKIPGIGWMATAVGTVYVDRGEGSSREAARERMKAAVARSPTPIALAPEGGVRHGPLVSPFRHGAFEVARDADAEILLAVIDFLPRGRFAWLERESLVRAYWRLGARTTPVVARIVALPPASGVTVAPPEAAARSEARMDAALQSLWREDATQDLARG